MWRLNVELRQGAAFSEATEERASKIAGTLLFALAAYVVVSASLSLWHRQGSDFSTAGLILAGVAIPAMYVLSRSKLRVAEELGSRALRADAAEAITCGYLSLVVLIGLVAQLLFHAWWVDGVASFAIVYFLVREGREAWEGDDCCADYVAALPGARPASMAAWQRCGVRLTHRIGGIIGPGPCDA